MATPQTNIEPKDLLKSCATCELVLPLDEPQQLIWSVRLGSGDGGGVVSCMEQMCALAATGRGGTKGLRTWSDES